MMMQWRWSMLSMDQSEIKRNGFYIDIGSSTLTYLLEHKYHWSGICIDANPNVIDQTKKDRPNSSCINSLVWHYHTYLDFETEINEFSGRVSNIPHNPKNDNIVSKQLTEAQTIEQICSNNNIIIPNIVDYIILDCNGSEIYLLDNIFKQQKFLVSDLSIRYTSNTYLQKLIDKIKALNKYVNRIDHQYIDVSSVKNSNRSVWISYRGFFSMINKQIWCGCIDNKNIDNLRLLESNQHCMILSNGINTYKICNYELYEIIRDNSHKITDGEWI